MVPSVLSLFCITSAVFASTFALSDNLHGGASIGPRRHAEVARHVETRNITERGYQYNNMRATWYDAGLGACGITNAAGDFIVALAQNTFGFTYPSPYCNRPIVISYNGQIAHATITDSCVACSEHDPHALDFTKGLFTHFAGTGAGVIYVDWSFTDVGGGDGNTPTTTSHHHTTTSHTTSEHTSSSKSHHTSHTSSSTSTTTPSPTSTSSPVDSGNFYNLNEFVLGLENLVRAAAA